MQPPIPSGTVSPQTRQHYVDERNRRYLTRQLSWYDHDSYRQDEYQRLRADIFVKSLGWQIPVDAQGRERDRYDTSKSTSISVSCVYGQDEQAEHLLGGV